ncbi:hypothetical protein PP742_gp61 [Alcaligenes phage vB_Af_QDWS595]|uniref:Uncharacterized protein n=1 Tax=Alcaligenes phage vB_Af_QDWS595 TaxID=2877946 RepID=A0AAE8Y1E1_9CAUD|nr:hypothetical protein PP742_gp61 [Alcaligenes phage vB_Af_QDWS595]UCR75545.1 hypothetical protein vBAfaPQDWS595_61 [Alcaligenes phage vB_Af_QDWS595]
MKYFMAIVVLAWFLVVVGLSYTAIHFIIKFW